MSKKRMAKEKPKTDVGDLPGPGSDGDVDPRKPPDYDAARLRAYQEFERKVYEAMPFAFERKNKRRYIATIQSIEAHREALKAKLSAIDDLESPKTDPPPVKAESDCFGQWRTTLTYTINGDDK